MGNVVLLPRHSRATRDQALALRKLARELDIPDDARHVIDNALYKITETPGRRWTFVMINQEQFRFVAKAVQGCRNVATTYAVWNCAITYARMDVGEILATREQLATDAGTTVQEVSRAMSELVKIGALVRKRFGRRVVYSINPHVGWAGGEGTRLEAATDVPKLRLVQKAEPGPKLTTGDLSSPQPPCR